MAVVRCSSFAHNASLDLEMGDWVLAQNTGCKSESEGLAIARPVPSEWKRLGFRPGPVLRVFGMRRSGNHAMIDWLLRNAPAANSVFLNNCVARKDPLRHFGSIAVNGMLSSSKKARKDLAAIASPAGEGAILLISYEDTLPSDGSLRRPISGDFDETLITSDVIIYRSFLNWSASLLKKLQLNTGYSVSNRMQILFRAVGSYFRMLELVASQKELEVTAICYDEWCSDDLKRMSILNSFGWPVRDNSLGKIQNYGGGSSFQKTITDPTGLESDNRWRQMLDDPEYRAFLFLCAGDAGLMEQLEQTFPSESARLSELATGAVSMAGGQQ